LEAAPALQPVTSREDCITILRHRLRDQPARSSRLAKEQSRHNNPNIVANDISLTNSSMFRLNDKLTGATRDDQGRKEAGLAPFHAEVEANGVKHREMGAGSEVIDSGRIFVSEFLSSNKHLCASRCRSQHLVKRL